MIYILIIDWVGINVIDSPLSAFLKGENRRDEMSTEKVTWSIR